MSLLNRAFVTARNINHDNTFRRRKRREKVKVLAYFCEGAEFEEKDVFADLLHPFHWNLTSNCYIRPALSPGRIDDPLDINPRAPVHLDNCPFCPHIRLENPSSHGPDLRDPNALHCHIYLWHAFCDSKHREAPKNLPCPFCMDFHGVHPYIYICECSQSVHNVKATL